MGQGLNPLVDPTADSVLERLAAALDADGWDTSRVDGLPVLQAAVRGASGEWLCQAWWLDEIERFVFYSIAPVPVPLDRVDEAIRYANAVNGGLTTGAFEVDADDGTVRLKTAVAVSGDGLTDELVRRQADANVATMDHFLPGLLRVGFADRHGDVEAASAVAAATGPVTDAG